MRTIFILSLCVFFSWACNARNIDDILDQREIKKKSYILETGLMQAVVINMQFGESEVISNSDRVALKKAQIVQVDLVYSDFPSDYDMRELNRKRIQVIQNLRADIISDESISWKLIRQMRCKNEAEAKTLFHGVVIHYRPEQSKETMAADTRWMDRYLPPADSLDSPLKVKKALTDTSVIHVLNRNSKTWNKMVVVSDLTGSMAPFASQVILWLKLSSEAKKLSSITFFNDGDMQLDKPIGRTGGIYTIRGNDYDSIRTVALQTISKGNGGDCPENDIEALIYAQKKYPDAKELILIADNMAPVKDIILLKEIKIPVRVILCGTTYGINIEYLKLARETKGSVHTMEQDLKDLAKLNEGAVFILNGQSYKILGGEIVEVKKS